MNEQLIEKLQKYNEEFISQGYLPTIELLIEKLKEVDMVDEARRQVQNDKANS